MNRVHVESERNTNIVTMVILWVEYNDALMEISQPELICDKDK